MESALIHIDALLYMFGSIVFIDIIRRVDRFLTRNKPATDEEYLSYLAYRHQVSEHDLFFYAAHAWAHSESRVEADFADYLINGRLPHYVRDFVRRERNLSKAA